MHPSRPPLKRRYDVRIRWGPATLLFLAAAIGSAPASNRYQLESTPDPGVRKAPKHVQEQAYHLAEDVLREGAELRFLPDGGLEEVACQEFYQDSAQTDPEEQGTQSHARMQKRFFRVTVRNTLQSQHDRFYPDTLTIEGTINALHILLRDAGVDGNCDLGSVSNHNNHNTYRFGDDRRYGRGVWGETSRKQFQDLYEYTLNKIVSENFKRRKCASYQNIPSKYLISKKNKVLER
ncbi:hypothetical protein D6783_05210 [Candidatus Woesearchaeota archaeon]|nr:MAG: hypothetical protein D6783_05210 [Candidatus Woesearchaeota archaeon]